MFSNSRLMDVFDACLRPRIRVLGRSWSAFHVWGCSSLALAILLTMTLVMCVGLWPVVMAVIILAALATFFGLVMATKIIAGEERVIYYHHEIAVIAVAALLLWVLRQPALPYLDASS